jgi:hypothetical protein
MAMIGPTRDGRSKLTTTRRVVPESPDQHSQIFKSQRRGDRDKPKKSTRPTRRHESYASAS